MNKIIFMNYIDINGHLRPYFSAKTCIYRNPGRTNGGEAFMLNYLNII